MKGLRVNSGFWLLTGLLVFVFMSCEKKEMHTWGEKKIPGINSAIANVYPVEGYEVNGTVIFSKSADQKGIRVIAQIKNLEPGSYGIHIHEFGNCAHPAFKTAGGYFNPEGMGHGGNTSQERHVGDLGNIMADSNMYAKLDYIDTVIAFSGKKSIIGRSVIIHSGVDDLTSRPSGSAGKRIACGAIGIAAQ